MQKFEFLRQPLLGELAMSRKKKKEERKNAIYSGHLRLWQQPRAAHALRSDQNYTFIDPFLTSFQFLVGRLRLLRRCEAQTKTSYRNSKR